MKKFLMAVAACAALAGCAASPPESKAQQADDAVCTAQADAVYNQQTVDEQARTAQPGLLYGAMPTHVFDAEQLGAEHVRQSAITKCEDTGNTASGPEVNGTPVVTPHIINSP